MKVTIPYGSNSVSFNVPDENFCELLEPFVPEVDNDEDLVIEEALENPIGSPRLCEMAVGKKNVVVISSDHTRPVPSHIIMPHQ